MATQSYQVLARKWRPRQFDEVVGQDAVVRTLSNALRQRRVAHAYCFSGIRGVGKTTMARLLAMGLNCHAADHPTAEMCNECVSCREIMAGTSIDVLERDAASDRRIDDIRELIEIARYAPARDRHKVIILDEAHMLTPEASNALLKLLEEPPPYVVLVLATTEPEKILTTILSRCQHYQFGRVSQREIVGQLGQIAEAEGIAVTDDSLALIATAADGSLRDAQSLLDKLIAFAGDEIDEATVVDLLGLVERVLLFRATDLIAEQDVAGVLGFVNEMVESGVDLHQFAVDLLGHLRALMVSRAVPEAGEILHLPEADMDRVREQAERFALEDLDRAFHLLSDAEYRIKVAEQPRHHLEVALARLARLPHLEPLESLIAELRQGADERQGAAAGSREGGGSGPAPGSDRRRGGGRQPDGRSEASATGPEEPGEITATAASGSAEEAGGEPRALLDRIKEQVGSTHPLVAGVLDRTSGIELAGERIVFNFPPDASILSKRVESPDVLELLSDVSRRILGREVVARVGIAASPRPEARRAEPGGTRPVAPVGDTPAAGPQALDPDSRSTNGAGGGPAGRAAARRSSPGPPSPADEPPGEFERSAETTTASPGDDAVDRETLMRRVENEPLVQEFVRALKGQITSVEKL